jgi:hypothetical protein
MVLLAAGFGAWRAHLLGEVAAKMKALSALLHWKRRLLAGALAGWHAGAALARGRATLELLAVRGELAAAAGTSRAGFKADSQWGSEEARCAGYAAEGQVYFSVPPPACAGRTG